MQEYADKYSAHLALKTGSAKQEADPVVIDAGYNSETVAKDWLFCCIAGERTDGHDFAPEALEKGASALLTQRPLDLDIPQILSSDVRRDMGRLSSIIHGEPSSRLRMFAVTGTNGKSTTTWIMRHLLESLDMRPGLIGTVVYNDGVEEVDAGRTTPESCDIQRLLASMVRNGCDSCVMETSSHGLDLGRVEGCLFDSAVFTNLSEEHLDYHETLEGYFSAKARLFAGYMKETWAGAANMDDRYARRLMDLYPERFLSFGLGNGNSVDVHGEDPACSLDGTRFTLTLKSIASPFSSFIPLPGVFNVYNALAALAAVLPYSYDGKALAGALSGMVQVPGRMEKISLENGVRCIVDFAHTPEALRNVLTELRRLCDGRVISVFGHGGERFQPNRFSLGKIASDLADEIIVTMDNPRNEPPEQIAAQIVEGIAASERKTSHRTILDRKAAVYEALDSAKPGDVVAVTGKGPEKYLCIGDESFPYSDVGAINSWALERGVGVL
ncbi:MAG: UDP-N-acetylmuramoyl-L-alanyl-D-glutamate--2,6-diaminopimelate ligase [Synergistota bacterium]|nr:UDP-N-acetylmuramoyl-L-alanyl-D-glutamate--2,6-diaminopimelate ligase [Synergistota bacterium]